MARRVPWVGRSLLPREHLRFLQGRGRYVDDIVLAGMLYISIVRSPIAHARLRDVYTSDALRHPGVVAVLTAGDLATLVAPVPSEGPAGGTWAAKPHPVLAVDRLRYVGEPVAGVVAGTWEAAEDAAALVRVDYEALPAVVDAEASLRGDVVLHEDLGSNILVRWTRAAGDMAAALREAAHVVRQRFHIPRLVAAPMEPRGVIAAYDAGTDIVTLWSATMDPHRPREQFTALFRRPADRVRVIVPDVGGAFGSKNSLASEAAVAAAASIRLARPVKWIETRRENFLASHQGRGLDADVQVAVGADGRIRALRASLLADLGAYLAPGTATVPVNSAKLLTGLYAIPAADVELIGVATNKVPLGPYRGAGRPEAAYLIERMMNLAARTLAMDPVEMRRRNLIPRDRLPYTTPLGFTYDSGDYARVLDRALELIEYTHWRTAQARNSHGGRLVGIGVAAYVERAAPGEWESAAATVRSDGHVVVRTGSMTQGQGQATVFAQIAADALGLEPDQVTIEQGDSSTLRGVGTFGSRSTTIGGSAVLRALEMIDAKAVRIAAHLLEVGPKDVVSVGGRYQVRGVPGRALTLAEVANASRDAARLPTGMAPGLEVETRFVIPAPVFPYGAYAAVVEVLPETGEVRVLKLVAVDDAGRIVNPLLAEGQVLGSTVQGLGQALLEEAVYDPQGQLITGSFMDYGLLRAAHVPHMTTEFIETPSPLTPLGTKGLGEAGTIGAPAALANAVADALAPFGIRHVDFPLSPEKIWRIVRAHTATTS